MRLAHALLFCLTPLGTARRATLHALYISRHEALAGVWHTTHSHASFPKEFCRSATGVLSMSGWSEAGSALQVVFCSASQGTSQGCAGHLQLSLHSTWAPVAIWLLMLTRTSRMEPRYTRSCSRCAHGYRVNSVSFHGSMKVVPTPHADDCTQCRFI